MRLIQSYVGVSPLDIDLEKSDILPSRNTRFKSVAVANPEKQVVLIGDRIRYILHEVISQYNIMISHNYTAMLFGLWFSIPQGSRRDILTFYHEHQ